MNTTQNLINLFVLKSKDGAKIRWRIPLLVILSLVVALAAIGVYTGISAGENTATLAQQPSLSQNPELKVVQRYAEGSFVEANRLAVNPELKYAQRYNEAAMNRSQTLYGDTNPELSLHLRSAAQTGGLAIQSTNPELMIHLRSVEMSQKNKPASFLAENPEIKVFRRFEEVDQ
jgi:hypothetical protein